MHTKTRNPRRPAHFLIFFDYVEIIKKFQNLKQKKRKKITQNITW